ncbi:hypothetical protein OE749_14395 [Aestuariibacter sp. AA17]|uniref:Uncharacterized protein n=1 Tax=Fluctibacter corallii TaxID=2984329 RepID=A0ABT3AB34_9ALTE|nr:hypothetical protein [Aestuariibacter sp. AA17]MCV2885885.1 hypothetical protein [Aestuariibacter sp. AA17]
MKHLCPNHRAWLRSHLDAAINLFHTSMDTVQILKEQGATQASLIHLGYALDTATVILLNGHHDSRFALYADVTLRYVQDLCEHGQQTQASAILLRAVGQLETLLPIHSAEPESLSQVLNAIAALHRADSIFSPSSVH